MLCANMDAAERRLESEEDITAAEMAPWIEVQGFQGAAQSRKDQVVPGLLLRSWTVYRIQRRGGGQGPIFADEGGRAPKFQNFPKIIWVPPLYTGCSTATQQEEAELSSAATPKSPDEVGFNSIREFDQQTVILPGILYSPGVSVE